MDETGNPRPTNGDVEGPANCTWRAFHEHRSTMLAGADFAFAKGDVDWMENY